MRTPAPVLDAYGTWIAGLAPWTHFVTLTHRLPDSSDANRARHYTRVGFGRHRRLVREWFHSAVRPRDLAARWWSELELHESGVPHEHGLLALAENAPALSIRQAWWDLAGYGRLDRIKYPERVARYVAKYAGKEAAWAPCVWGFGLLREASFSQTLRQGRSERSWKEMRGPETALEGMVESFIVHRSDLSEATVRNYRVALNAFVRWCERELGRAATVGDIEPGTVEAYLKHRRLSVSAETARVGWVALRSIAHYLAELRIHGDGESVLTCGCRASRKITVAT